MKDSASIEGINVLDLDSEMGFIVAEKDGSMVIIDGTMLADLEEETEPKQKSDKRKSRKNTKDKNKDKPAKADS